MGCSNSKEKINNNIISGNYNKILLLIRKYYLLRISKYVVIDTVNMISAFIRDFDALIRIVKDNNHYYLKINQNIYYYFDMPCQKIKRSKIVLNSDKTYFHVKNNVVLPLLNLQTFNLDL